MPARPSVVRRKYDTLVGGMRILLAAHGVEACIRWPWFSDLVAALRAAAEDLHRITEPTKYPERVATADLVTSRGATMFRRDFKLDSLAEADRLAAALDIPEKVIAYRPGASSSNYHVTDGTRALLIVLYKLGWPHRWIDAEQRFGESKSTLSAIWIHMLHFLTWRWQARFRLHPPTLRPRLPQFCEAINRRLRAEQERRGVDIGFIDNVVGFIDASVHQSASPGEGEPMFFAAHRYKRGLKFQSIMMPDGIMYSMYGPVDGSYSDNTVLSRSNEMPTIAALCEGEENGYGVDYCLYGDNIYSLTTYIQRGFVAAEDHSEAARHFNRLMSSVRVCVEWGFGLVTHVLFRALSYTPKQRMRVTPTSRQYLAATLLYNCLTCMQRGTCTSDYFYELEPPELEDYLSQEHFPQPAGNCYDMLELSEVGGVA